MRCAFVLLNMKPRAEGEVEAQLLGMKNVKEIYRVSGIYDFIVTVEAATVDELRSCVGEVRRLDKVQSTLTLTVTE